MAITKDQASDLHSCAEEITKAAIALEYAQMRLKKAQEAFEYHLIHAQKEKQA
jgi:hypothetical protein